MLEIGIVVAIIIACGEFAKKYITAKYIPVVTMVLGVIAGMIYLPHADIQTAIFNGVMVGLMSNGMYDATKMFKE